LVIVLALVSGSGCSGSEQQADSGSVAQEQGSMEASQPASVGVMTALCELSPTEGSTVGGTVMFAKVDGGIKVTAHVTGLTPGKHGFHIHEKGDCSAMDGTSAGGHFNPDSMAHGGPDAEVRHEGDLGNLTADSTGTANYEYVDSHLALEGDHSILGRAIIVHANADDFTTQPTGAAGARVACGVIEVGSQ